MQRLRCQATAGKFAIAFADQRVVNIPWNASAYTLRHFLQRMTKIDDVIVTYLQQEDRACTYLGNEFTVTFESVNMDGIDGDLPEMTTDMANKGGDGAVLQHIQYQPALTPLATEVQKGRLVTNRVARFTSQPGPQTLRFTYVVQNGDNTTRTGVRQQRCADPVHCCCHRRQCPRAER
ncbi:hypothetical protein PINS_up014701 [Pythium insidiosum]|nr:hypothetical protein PINS_up014701 [Pythium insidiosum]